MNHAGDYGLWGRACFDPVTLLSAAVATTVAGTGITAMGQIRAGQAANAAGKYNAAVAEQNAVSATQAGATQSGMAYEDNRRKLAGAEAAASANGLDASQGSALDVLADHAGAAKLDEEMIRWNAGQQARGYRSQATLDRFQGKQAAAAGGISAAGTLLSGAGKAAAIGSSI
jgi:hypothetical protein